MTEVITKAIIGNKKIVVVCENVSDHFCFAKLRVNLTKSEPNNNAKIE